MGEPLERDSSHAERVEPVPTVCERPDHEADRGVRVAATDRADTDERLSGEVDASALVEVRVDQVVMEMPALEHRDERQGRVEVAEPEVVVDSECLMLADVEPGLLEDLRLAHPVLGSGEVEHPDLVSEPSHLSDVLVWRNRPAPMISEFSEASGVERPRNDGAVEVLDVVEPSSADEQRNVERPLPGHGLGAEVEGRAQMSLRTSK